jgi:pimeloyl-ACP methyl ester carboxylesterase
MQFIVEGYPAYAYTGGREFDPRLPALLFIHGAALDHSVWQWQSRYFAHHGFSVLAVDLPGHGRSPGAARASIEEYGAWVDGLADAAGLAAVNVVGASMGSLIALELALKRPARVAKLALIGTAMPMAVGEAFLAAARENSDSAFEMETVWGHRRLSQLQQSPVPGIALTGASLRLNARAKPGVQHADLRACNTYQPAMESIRALRVPTLVLGGRRDQMTQFKAGKALAAEIPGAKFVALDAGHSMMSEAPRETLAELRSFLG